MTGPDLPLDPVEMVLLHETGWFGVPEEKLEAIAAAVSLQGLDLFDAAWECGIDPANLSDEDVRAIREMVRNA